MMRDIKLFRRNGAKVSEKPPKGVTVERVLHDLMATQPERCLGVPFHESPQVAGRLHAGRIDVGIAKAGSPVIIEYKRASPENVVKEDLLWLDWLLDRRDEREVLVQRKPRSEDVVTWEPLEKVNRKGTGASHS